MNLTTYHTLQRQSDLRRCSPDQYRALRHEHRELARWLRLNRRPYTTGCDENRAAAERWDAKHLRKAYLDALFPAWQPGDGDVLDRAQRVRRGKVQQAAWQRALQRRAQALDTSGLSPLQAAWARLEISFGGKA